MRKDSATAGIGTHEQASLVFQTKVKIASRMVLIILSSNVCFEARASSHVASEALFGGFCRSLQY